MKKTLGIGIGIVLTLAALLAMGAYYQAGGTFSLSASDWSITRDLAVGRNAAVTGAATVGSLASSGAVSGTTGTFSGAVGVASLAATGAVTGASATITGVIAADTAAITKTLTAHTATIAGVISGDTASITKGLSAASGTFTKTVSGDTASITKGISGANLTATTTFTYQDYTGAPLQVLKNDTIAATVTTGTTTADVAGSTVLIAAGVLDAGEVVNVTCYGTAAGTTSTKRISLLFGSTAGATITSQLASAGGWSATFRVGEYTDAAHQLVTGEMMISGGTVDGPVFATPTATTVNMALAHTLTIKIATPTKLSNEMTLYACDWGLRP